MYSMCILTFAKAHNTAKKEILRQPSCVFGRHFPAQARVFPLGFQRITGPEVMWIARSARKAFRPLWSSGPCGSGSRAGAGPSCGGSLNDRTCDRRRMHHRSAFGAPIPLVKPGQDTVKGLRAPVVYTRISQRGLVGSCSTLVGKTGSDDDVPSKKKKPTPKTTPSDSDSGSATTTHAFQAETKRLLDIVTNSLYTDKEVFVRELVSNASDALEKCRHFYLANGEDPGLLTVDIKTNEADGTFTIVDTGLGMTKSDLQNNLGVIARSGSKEFVETLSGGGGDSSGSVAESTKNIIGKFGVGFYSAFMVAEKVDVYSSIGDGVGHKWSSTGDGKYTISQCAIGDGENESPTRGTKITLQIKESDKQLAVSSWAVESVLKKYSAFVSFPVMLNDKKTNAIEALWRRKENEVTDEDATAFYRFIGTNASVTDNFAFRLHFSADAPLTVRALLFAPTDNPERGFGGSQSGNNNESGVSLYSRRVLIQQNARNVLPSFLRFVRGVIDCEDVPLNISRETLQDSALVKKLGEIISKRVIKWLTEKAKKEPEKYNAWYAKLGVFLKEGVCGDESYLYKDLLVPLLRFESTNVVSNKDDKVSKDKDNAGNNTKDETKKQTASVTSLDEYVARMPAHQSEIYYLVATGGRKQAERSPYLEAMHARGFEVLFLYAHVDEFVMQHVRSHRGKQLCSAEAAEFDELGDDSKEEEKDASSIGAKDGTALSAPVMQTLCDWFATEALAGKVTGVSTSSKLTATPALLTGHEPEAMRRYRAMLTMMADENTSAKLNELQNASALELNPKHAIVKGIEALRKSGDAKKMRVAKLVAEQVFDNARVAAGALDDPREMVGRIHDILEIALQNETPGTKRVTT